MRLDFTGSHYVRIARRSSAIGWRVPTLPDATSHSASSEPALNATSATPLIRGLFIGHDDDSQAEISPQHPGNRLEISPFRIALGCRSGSSASSFQ